MPSAWESILRHQRTTLHAMDRTLREAGGYSLDQYDVLHQLAGATQPVRMGTLADRLLVANSSCTYIVRGLVGDGLVERHEIPDDGRAVGVTLTSAGRTVHRTLATLHAADIDRLFTNRLTDRDLASLRRIFGRLTDARPT